VLNSVLQCVPVFHSLLWSSSGVNLQYLSVVDRLVCIIQEYVQRRTWLVEWTSSDSATLSVGRCVNYSASRWCCSAALHRWATVLADCWTFWADYVASY